MAYAAFDISNAATIILRKGVLCRSNFPKRDEVEHVEEAIKLNVLQQLNWCSSALLMILLLEERDMIIIIII